MRGRSQDPGRTSRWGWAPRHGANQLNITTGLCQSHFGRIATSSSKRLRATGAGSATLCWTQVSSGLSIWWSPTNFDKERSHCCLTATWNFVAESLPKWHGKASLAAFLACPSANQFNHWGCYIWEIPTLSAVCAHIHWRFKRLPSCLWVASQICCHRSA